MKLNEMKMKPLKTEAIHETGLSGNVVASFFPLIIFILLCFNVLSTVSRENRLADFLYIYIYIYVCVCVCVCVCVWGGVRMCVCAGCSGVGVVMILQSLMGVIRSN